MITDWIRKIRRNHGLEHATIHMLSEQFSGFAAQGNASYNGFYLNLYGQVPAEAVETAARTALQKMKDGQHGLALHPNCGTVLLTTATMATLAGQAVFSVERKRYHDEPLSERTVFWNGLPAAILAVVVAMIASRPVGMHLQTYTTDGVPGDLEIVRVHHKRPSPVTHLFRVLLGLNKRGPINAYFIETRGG